MKECPKCETCFADDVGICPHDGLPTRSTLPGPQLIARRYFLERRIGRGAMGQVYLARDENLGTRHVAVKTVRPDVLNSDDLQEGEAIARFEREARAAALIRHPHVVAVTDFGKTTEGICYLAMEYVEGETLHQLLRREGTLSIKRTVGLLRQICDGVEAAHEFGIVHRDLKPANIFILRKRKEGDDGFVKVGDFGLAKIVRQTITDSTSEAVPSSRGIVGTPEFMAPEQMQQGIIVDNRTDIYALGTIAFLMFGGRTPFTGDLMQLVTQKLMDSPPKLSTFRTDIPKEIEASVMWALETEADKRPATISDWISDLEKAAHEASVADVAGASRLVILAPLGAEVYLDDERRGSIGSSARLVLKGIPFGQHVLRVSRGGERDDERVIEIRDDGEEQVIQAQLGSLQTRSQPSSGKRGGATSDAMPRIVACAQCASRFAEGVKFCGRCGSNVFAFVAETSYSGTFPCPKCATQLPEHSRFCGRCGLRLGESESAIPAPTRYANPAPAVERICTRCGAAFGADVKFCGRCGNNLRF